MKPIAYEHDRRWLPAAAGMAVLCFTVVAHAETVTITTQACQALTRHVPAADVAYQAGVDVYGKAVASADLNGARPVKLPDVLTIELTPEIEKWLPQARINQYPYDRLKTSRLNLGAITIEGNRVAYNGLPLSDDQQENLAVVCMDKNTDTH